MGNIKYIIIALFFIIPNSIHSQVFFDSNPRAKRVNDYLEQKKTNIVIKDTISFIKELLEMFESNPKPSDYLKKYIINDTLFEKYSKLYKRTEWYPERIKKRKDLVLLFYIHFELYLKYKKPDDYDIVNIYITTDDFRFKKMMPVGGFIDMRSPYCEIGNKYIDNNTFDTTLLSEKFVHYLYPDQKKMEEVHMLYKSWIKKVEKLGSLEKARKKGLNPFRKSDFKWCINYFKKENNNYRNSFFPRYAKSNFVLEYGELRTKEWKSSYRDKNAIENY